MSVVGTFSRNSHQSSGGTGSGTGGGTLTSRLSARSAATGSGLGGGTAVSRISAREGGTGSGTGGGVIILPIPAVHVRIPATTLLELDRVSRRQESIRFDLLDSGNRWIGDLAVVSDRPADISNDGSRRIRRQLSNVVISPSDLNEIDTVSQRVRPWWILGEGGTGYEFSLGIFLFADASELIATYGSTLQTTLYDQCLILDQPLLRTVSYPTGTNVGAALAEQASLAGLVNVRIDSTDAVLGAPLSWVVGRDSRLVVMEKLCILAGFLPPYFDNDGALICRSAPDLSTVVAERIYGPGGRVVDGSIVASNDLLKAPNVYLAIDTSATDAPIVGRYDVPATAPHSIAHRGFPIPEVIEAQGLASQAAADQAAAARAAASSGTFTWLSFDSTPDPRHDTFDVVAFSDVNYREQSWRLPLEHGARMNHDLRGTYQVAA